VVLFLAFLISNRHSKTGTFNWMTPIWADQAGYYVYLPSLFVYHFDAKSFPEKIEEKTGFGFSLDPKNNKVITRYTCGIAILQAPFFILAHTLAGILGQPQDGFSGIYHQVPNWASLFYSFLGLFFLWKFLLFYYKQRTVIFTLISLFFGTNLYYYSVDSTGMSHIYSFALFVIVAWLTKRLLSSELKNRNLFLIARSLLFALIVLTRPTNILLFPFLFCLDCQSIEEFRLRVKRFFTSGEILMMIVSFLIVFLPQFLYWKYATGNYVTDSYQGFGFSNWKSPKILELWFSPNNGLFLYSPFYLVALLGAAFMIKHRKFNGWVILLTFFVLTYVFASWFIFSFGCGFGSRNFVEYTVLFSLPVGYLFKQILDFSMLKRITITAVVVVLVIFNLNLAYAYNRCFQGGDWDYQEYMSFLVKSSKYHQALDINSQESLPFKSEYSKTLYLQANKLYFVKYKMATVKTEVTLDAANSEALLVVSVEIPDSTIYWGSLKLRDQVPDNKLHKKQIVEGDFWIPVSLPKNATIAAYIWNKNKESLAVSKLILSLE
jgi:hypothetical protein